MILNILLYKIFLLDGLIIIALLFEYSFNLLKRKNYGQKRQIKNQKSRNFRTFF